jgi:hypothetical protein
MIALLRKRAERPSGYGAADKSDELAPPHLKPPDAAGTTSYPYRVPA